MAMSNQGNSLGDPLSEKKLYSFSRLPAHLADAGQLERLYLLLTDFWFLVQKVVKRLKMDGNCLIRQNDKKMSS